MAVPLVIICILSSAVVLIACFFLFKSKKRSKIENLDKSHSYEDYNNRCKNSTLFCYQTNRDSKSTIYSPKTYETPQFSWLSHYNEENDSTRPLEAKKLANSTVTRSSQNETCFSNSEYQFSYRNSREYI